MIMNSPGTPKALGDYLVAHSRAYPVCIPSTQGEFQWRTNPAIVKTKIKAAKTNSAKINPASKTSKAIKRASKIRNKTISSAKARQARNPSVIAATNRTSESRQTA
jgi:hypothetical protein